MISANAFRRLLLRCFEGRPPNKVLVALSGGVDSMCLTYLLSQYRRQVQPLMKIYAVTIDHGFRAELSEEAAQVGQLVLQWGVTHAVEKLRYEQDVSDISNFEEVARNLRYQVFQEQCDQHGIGTLMVAHNLDDQVETFLQRLQMNSTIYGLLGLKPSAKLPIRPSGPDQAIEVLRPLLAFDKAAIRATCEQQGVKWFEDATNVDPHLTKRNLLRYMINDYVPTYITARPELACVSKGELLTSVLQIQQTLTSLHVNQKALNAYIKEGTFTFNAQNACISFTVPVAFWCSLDDLVSGKWLYLLISPFSSTNHLHWMYAKLQRQAIPRIKNFLAGPEDIMHMTYLNMSFKLEKAGDQVKFEITKQEPQRHERLLCDMELTDSMLSWTLLDKCWWLRASCESDRTVEVLFYNSSMKRQVMAAFPEFAKTVKGSFLFAVGVVPVIIDKDTREVLSLPTHGLVRDGVDIECVLKDAIA